MIGLKIEADQGNVYHAFENWGEVSFRTFLKYKEAEVEFNQALEELNKSSKGEDKDFGKWLEITKLKPEQDQGMLQCFIGLCKMIQTLTTIPEQVLMNRMTKEQILQLGDSIPVIQSGLPKDQSRKFIFRDALPSELDDIKKEIKECKIYQWVKKKKLQDKLKGMIDLHYQFFISDDIGIDSMTQWIQSDSIRRKITQLEDGIKQEQFNLFPELLANICRTQDEHIKLQKEWDYDYYQERVDRRKEVFLDVDVETIMKCMNFFLDNLTQ